MKRPLIALFALVLLATCASAAERRDKPVMQRSGPVRNFLHAIVDRIAHRQESKLAGLPQQWGGARSVAPTPDDCPDGTCPLRRSVALAQPAAIPFDFPRRMP